MRAAKHREKVLRIGVSHGEIERVFSVFQPWHVSTSRNAELATSLIMLRNSDIYARIRIEAHVICTSHGTSCGMRMPKLIRSSRVSVVPRVQLAGLNYNVRANANLQKKKERLY